MKDPVRNSSNFRLYCKKLIFCAGFFIKKSNQILYKLIVPSYVKYE